MFNRNLCGWSWNAREIYSCVWSANKIQEVFVSFFKWAQKKRTILSFLYIYKKKNLLNLLWFQHCIGLQYKCMSCDIVSMQHLIIFLYFFLLRKGVWMRTHSWRYAKVIWSITCVLWRIRRTSVCLNCLRRQHLRKQWSIKMLKSQSQRQVCYYTHRPSLRMRV